MTNAETGTKENLKEQVREFIVSNFLFGDGAIQFNDEDSFLEKGIIDSTGILELIEYLETTYNLSIDDEELVPENLDSLDNVNNFINRKISENRE